MAFSLASQGQWGNARIPSKRGNATQTRSFSTGLGLPGFLTQEASLFSPFPFQEAIRHKSFFGPERKLECGDVDEAFKMADQILEGKACFSREPQGNFLVMSSLGLSLPPRNHPTASGVMLPGSKSPFTPFPCVSSGTYKPCEGPRSRASSCPSPACSVTVTSPSLLENSSSNTEFWVDYSRKFCPSSSVTMVTEEK